MPLKYLEMSYNADMPKDMIKEAQNLIIEAFETESLENAVATHIKREFVKRYKGVWHCVVGKNFGSFFRGDVGKLSKPKKNKAAKRAKSKKVVSLVKRSPKLAQDTLQSRIAELTSLDSAARVSIGGPKAGKAAAPPSAGKVRIGKAALEVVGKRKRERVVPEKEAPVQRSTAEAVGLKILHQAVKSQSHGRLLPHQNRHDYEYRLRSVATMGVVQLFNSLAQSRKASAALDTEKKMTSDKVMEKKQLVSKEVFLAALRQPQQH
ncbi:Dynein light chain type 1 family protein [Leishmania donovani]|uniref:Dynein light chain 1, cytoplasmic n=1 Tax=Leishmania donovani TaxID=5661 RepID=A0A504X4J0_LEIDO|nr:Dynein light chain type 1 family protein [Leishmania donovani]